MVKPHPDRVQAAWDLLEGPPSDEETAAEVEHLAKLGPDALNRELEEGGFELRQVDDDAEHLRQRLLQAAPEAPAAAPPTRAEPRTASVVDAVAPRARSPRRRNDYLSGFVLAALVLALAIGFARRLHGVRETPIARPDVPSLPTAPMMPSAAPSESVTLRIGATAACESEAWRKCLDLLDRAARLDPAGDATPEVRALRGQATDRLRAIEPKTSH